MKSSPRYEVAFLLIICLLAVLFASCEKGHQDKLPPKEIPVVTATKGEIENTVLFTGDIVADAAFDIFPRASGKVSKKMLKEGDPVKRNQAILVVERDEVGYKFKPMPVVSLADGYIGTISVDVGAEVKPETVVATVVKPSKMRVKLDVPERYLGAILPGTEIEMTVDALSDPDRTFKGIIVTSSPIVSEKTRTANVEAEFPNDDGLLRHGMFGKINLAVERHEGVLVVPLSTISWEGDKRFVYKVLDGKLARTEVKTGLRNDVNAELTEGVMEGDILANGNLLNLKDGEAVQTK